VSPTSSTGFLIEREYRSEDAHWAYSSSWAEVAGEHGIAGMTDPMLVDPIDFEAELAERRRTYEPLPPVDTDLTNPHFGI
jgi:hypothetical protein